MANVDAPFGLRPVRHSTGAPYNGAANKYYVPDTYSTALFIGDPVVRTGTSNTSAVRGFNPGTLPEINKATAGDGNAITGVIVGFEPISGFDAPIYGPADTERIALVADDPELVFHIQDDGAAALAATSVGLNAVLIYTHSGSTITGSSGAELDTNSDPPAADASNQLTIRRLANFVNNEIGVHAIWEVTINNHTEAHASLGI